MTALERIKEIEASTKFLTNSESIEVYSENRFLLRAFKVMREIAVQHHKGIEGKCKIGLAVEDCVSDLFERRMKEGE